MGLIDTVKSIIQNPVTAPWPVPASTGVKSITLSGDWSRPAYDSVTYGTSINYADAAGNLDANSIIMACIGWLMRAEPEPPWKVSKRTSEGVIHPPAHPLLTLLNAPNPFYSGIALRQATVFSYNLDGNAYWRKVRNSQGRVIQLWYEPHTTIRPVWPRDNSEFITKYQVLRNHQWYDIPQEDVVHFRDGINPAPGMDRYGQNRLATVLRDIATDNEAARFTYTLLRNLGISPVIISPANADTVWTADEADALKAGYIRNTTGDQRGNAVVNISSIKVDRLAFAPDEMDAEKIRMLPESRIAAILNMPPGLVGLLVGLYHNTYSNMDAAWGMAIKSNLAPFWRIVAGTVTHQLMPDLGDEATEYVSHDLTQVKVLQEDQTAISTRVTAGWQAGTLKRSEWRQATNWPVAADGSDDVYNMVPLLPAITALVEKIPVFNQPFLWEAILPGLGVKDVPAAVAALTAASTTAPAPPPASAAFLTALANLAAVMPELNQPFLWRAILEVAGVPDVEAAIRLIETTQAEEALIPPAVIAVTPPEGAALNGHTAG